MFYEIFINDQNELLIDFHGLGDKVSVIEFKLDPNNKIITNSCKVTFTAMPREQSLEQSLQYLTLYNDMMAIVEEISVIFTQDDTEDNEDTVLVTNERLDQLVSGLVPYIERRN